jgi:hypothetical protein
MNSKEVLKEIRTLLGFSKGVEMESATLVDGTVIEWEGELAVGTEIFVQTGEGLIPAPDATHEVEGGLLVSTEGGVVTEIVEPTETIEDEFEDVAEVVEEVITELEVVEDVAAIIDEITPDSVSEELSMEIAVEVISEIIDLIDAAPEGEAIVEELRKIRKMRKQKYSKFKRVNSVKKELESLKREFKKMKSGFSLTVDLVEKVANLPSDEPIKAPAKLSKKEEQFANIMKLAKHLKNK